MNETTEDRTLALIAQDILDAPDEERLETARANGLAWPHCRRTSVVLSSLGTSRSPHPRIRAATARSQWVRRRLRSDPFRVGIIASVVRTDRETRYGVFIGSRLKTPYESLLVVATRAATAPVLNADEYDARLIRAPARSK